METIFDHNPTSSELVDIQFDSISFLQRFGIELKSVLTKENYISSISQKFAYYDIAMLYEFREDSNTANKYWSKIPEIKPYSLGLDNLNIPI